jgi:hypothetical protein
VQTEESEGYLKSFPPQNDLGGYAFQTCNFWRGSDKYRVWQDNRANFGLINFYEIHFPEYGKPALT